MYCIRIYKKKRASAGVCARGAGRAPPWESLLLWFTIDIPKYFAIPSNVTGKCEICAQRNNRMISFLRSQPRLEISAFIFIHKHKFHLLIFLAILKNLAPNLAINLDLGTISFGSAIVSFSCLLSISTPVSYSGLSSRVGRVRPLSLFYSDASADGVEERSLVLRSRSHARLRRNVTMSHAFSCAQPAVIDL
ncbi:hypothetical protein EVAR_16257_1 [Eumeta japonica]|uniref:Uncharacterized protein n=1 Tax=Eumeta variegata TaxID=151549 RepID=A0A4C1U610_EUMVA|nr:hypothetical protein EVAR_16257_1 [Eumeta japonica]